MTPNNVHPAAANSAYVGPDDHAHCEPEVPALTSTHVEDTAASASGPATAPKGSDAPARAGADRNGTQTPGAAGAAGAAITVTGAISGEPYVIRIGAILGVTLGRHGAATVEYPFGAGTKKLDVHESVEDVTRLMGIAYPPPSDSAPAPKDDDWRARCVVGHPFQSELWCVLSPTAAYHLSARSGWTSGLNYRQEDLFPDRAYAIGRLAVALPPPDAAEDPAAPRIGNELHNRPMTPAENASATCGAKYTPVYGAPDECIQTVGHPGNHKGRSATWPCESPMQYVAVSVSLRVLVPLAEAKRYDKQETPVVNAVSIVEDRLVWHSDVVDWVETEFGPTKPGVHLEDLERFLLNPSGKPTMGPGDGKNQPAPAPILRRDQVDVATQAACELGLMLDHKDANVRAMAQRTMRLVQEMARA